MTAAPTTRPFGEAWIAASFAEVDRMDPDGLMAWYAEDGSFRFAGQRRVVGKDAIWAVLAGFYGAIRSMRHRRTGVSVDADHGSGVWEAEVNFVSFDRRAVSDPRGQRAAAPRRARARLPLRHGRKPIAGSFAMSGRWIGYADGPIALGGWLSVPPAGPGPGVVIVHTFRGLGYAAFALDAFGVGGDGAPVRPATHDVGRQVIKPFTTDQTMFRRRLRAGLDTLWAQPEYTGPAAAIGYCFGGAGVLEMARDGQPLAGVVSLNGELATAMAAAPGNIRCKVLVMHGDADPDPTAEYNAHAKGRSWARQTDFLAEVLAGGSHRG